MPSLSFFYLLQLQQTIEERDKTIGDLEKEKQDIKTENQSQIKSRDQQIAASKLELEKVISAAAKAHS